MFRTSTSGWRFCDFTALPPDPGGYSPNIITNQFDYNNSVHYKPFSITVILALLISGCAISLGGQETPTPTAFIITSTLSLPITPRATETPLPPPPSPTVAPVQGTTSTQLNVRAEPSTTSETLGIVAANTLLQIVGQDPGGNWWQIIYEAATDGKGWVTAQYVETAIRPEVPVIVSGGSDPGSGYNAVVIQQLNIRSGPATSFNSLGILNANDVVILTGKNRDTSWVQIKFAGGPEGTGWISSAFVRSDDLGALPIVSESGEVVGTGTPMDTPLPPTPTIVPAPKDFDSAENPLKTILFDRAGTLTLIYNGDVSTPDGDAEDWIAITPLNNFVIIGIECKGNGSLRAEIVGTGTAISCNESTKLIYTKAAALLLVHIEAVPASSSLQYINYTLTIKASQ